MKLEYILIAALGFGVACNSGTEAPAETTETNETAETDQPTEADIAEVDIQFFGEKINADGAEPVSNAFAKIMGPDSVPMKLTGVVNEVCQKKGCWMTIQNDEGQEMMVRFKDYGFFMPLDCAGQSCTFEGVAFQDTVPVEVLRHYAEDAGKSAEEIEAITEPELTVSFLASGVILENAEN